MLRSQLRRAALTHLQEEKSMQRACRMLATRLTPARPARSRVPAPLCFTGAETPRSQADEPPTASLSTPRSFQTFPSCTLSGFPFFPCPQCHCHNSSGAAKKPQKVEQIPTEREQQTAVPQPRLPGQPEESVEPMEPPGKHIPLQSARPETHLTSYSRLLSHCWLLPRCWHGSASLSPPGPDPAASWPHSSLCSIPKA